MFGWLRGRHEPAPRARSVPAAVVGRQLRRQDLQCDLATQLPVLGEVDLAQAALAELADDLVVAERFRGQSNPRLSMPTKACCGMLLLCCLGFVFQLLEPVQDDVMRSGKNGHVSGPRRCRSFSR